MKSHKFLIALIIVIIITSCSDKSDTSIDPRHYPIDKNYTLEYVTTLILQYYDSTGNLYDPETVVTESSVVKVLNSNATLGSYSNLYLLESYSTDFPDVRSKRWYQDSETGLYAIAYFIPEFASHVLPKQNIHSHLEQIRQSLSGIASPYFVLNNFSNTNDSVYFYGTPRFLIKYPISVGSKWIETSNGHIIERVVSDYKAIDVPAGRFGCYKIDRLSDNPLLKNLRMEEYINMNVGLIKRELVNDSLIFVLESGDTSGYFRFTEASELVGKH